MRKAKKDKHISLRCSKQEKIQLQMLAKRHYMNLSEYIRMVLDNEIDANLVKKMNHFRD